MERRRCGAMNRTWTFILAVVALIAASACGPVQAQNSIPPPQIVPPLTGPQAQYFQQNPQELQQLRDRLSQQAGQQPLAVRKLAPAQTPSAGSWTTLTTDQRRADVDRVALPSDLAVVAHAPDRVIGSVTRLTQDAVEAPRRGTT